MNLRLAVAAALAVGLSGCGGDICSRQSLCANDPKPTDSQIKQCQATLDANRNAVCYNEIVRYIDCAQKNTVCTAGNTTDVALTATKVTNNCSTQEAAANTCCASNQTSTACE